MDNADKGEFSVARNEEMRHRKAGCMNPRVHPGPGVYTDVNRMNH